MKKSETARLRMNLFPTVRRAGFFVAQINARMLPEIVMSLILHQISLVDKLLVFLFKLLRFKFQTYDISY